ncbi:hypothetical protein P4O66_021747 [Electrophorus voltai]|uniref:PH domain-containing protein n=1 Tax=Electrophorus voltai TaxID=2609070 RepID=A0AAD8YQL0_9TELE|nr:hypothetical protein P4O66_021747 [Electrophorus voltai]
MRSSGRGKHRRLLSRYQRRLDLSPLERQASPVAAQFKNLDLTTKKMIHEGPLTWKVSKDKAIDIHALLLSDLLVLLQRGPGDRLILRCPARSLGGVWGGNTHLKTTFCPVVRLDSSLVRSVATDNKALYVISTSERQIYELVAGTSSEKNTWKNLLEKTISSASGGIEATEQGSTAPSAVLRLHGNHVGRLDGSLSEESGSIERDSQSDDENVLTPTIPTDQSEAYMHTGGQGYVGGQAKVADAALQDVRTLRLLILGSLDPLEAASQKQKVTSLSSQQEGQEILASHQKASPTASKPERLGQASTESMPRLLMQSSTNELLTCLGVFLCRRCCLLKDLTADEPVQWLRIVDCYVTLTEWQEQSFLIPSSMVFLYMLSRDIISVEVATKEELQAVLLTCLYVSCSYMCEEISYPAKAFLVEENKGAFFIN